MIDGHASKRITIHRPHHGIQHQSVDLHADVPDVATAAHPGGPTVADAFKAANIKTPHLVMLRDGSVLQPEDHLFDRVSDGDQVTAVPVEEMKSFQEFPKSMFNEHGHSVLVTSEMSESMARAKGFHDSMDSAKKSAAAALDPEV